MKKRLRKGSLTIEIALIMSLLLLIIMSVIYLIWIRFLLLEVFPGTCRQKEAQRLFVRCPGSEK